MALILNADGTRQEVKGIAFTQMQEAVGGYVERVFLSDGRSMYVNEDGRMKQLPLNEQASQLAGVDIVGNAVVLTKKEEDEQDE